MSLDENFVALPFTLGQMPLLKKLTDRKSVV